MKVYSVEDRHFKNEDVMYSDCCTVHIAFTYEKAEAWCLKSLEEFGKGRNKTRKNGWVGWHFAIMEDEIDGEDGVIVASVFPCGSITRYFEGYISEDV